MKYSIGSIARRTGKDQWNNHDCNSLATYKPTSLVVLYHKELNALLWVPFQAYNSLTVCGVRLMQTGGHMDKRRLSRKSKSNNCRIPKLFISHTKLQTLLPIYYSSNFEFSQLSSIARTTPRHTTCIQSIAVPLTRSKPLAASRGDATGNIPLH